ncbi:hypothetical protein [Brevundimonas sp.]|jgi:hypothetical protein|uniref:hypothetical protein n=1 Tax=Brevundimonas sp. TaxID=1871086 RepID=UPI00391D38EE
MARTDTGRATIGGHFGLLLTEHDHPPPGRYGFESARAALYALLRKLGARQIHVPAYTCPDVGRACLAAGVEVVPYSLGPDFEPALPDAIDDDALVIVTDHFGLNRVWIDQARQRFPAERLVVDNAQAYFASSGGALAALYSPRKFLPVPDGGFLETELDVHQGPTDEAASLRHLALFAQRTGRPPEPSREAYLTAEARLGDISERGMSEITRQLIRCADQDRIRTIRQANFDRLAAALGDRNRLALRREDQTPLVYPLIAEASAAVRQALQNERVFCPRYWSGLSPTTAFEAALLEQAIFLPIDHRYGPGDMDRMIDIILHASETL